VVPTTEATLPAYATPAKTPRFTRAAWGVLAWNFVVVLWGAYVRASGSGAGCGSHWPLCNGEVVPRAPRLETIIEFTHRVTSGVALIATIGLAVWSFFLFPRRDRVRRMATLGVIFLVVEALLGAGLVLFQYVARNASIGRAFYLCLHLVNTQVLLGVLALTAWFSRGSAERLGTPRPVVFATLPITILVSITGVIAALGDTLFPAAGMQQDFSAGAHFLLRLRILHPALAILGACYFLFASIVVMRSTPRPIAARIAFIAMILALAQLGAGAINLALAAPIPMQIVHLFLADLVWLSLVLLTIEA
jgi:cytochrome c oxidase assembly protein subunit 15